MTDYIWTQWPLDVKVHLYCFVKRLQCVLSIVAVTFAAYHFLF